MKQLAKPALAAIRDGRVRSPRAQHAVRARLAREHPRLVHLAADLVGAPDPCWYCPDGHIDVAETTPDACAECGSTELRQDEDVLDTWFSSALWPFATLGWPDDDARPRLLLSERRQRDRPRDHLPLGGADDHGGPRVDGRGPVPRRDHPLDDSRARRPTHVEEPRHRHRPARGDRAHGADATRYGLLKMSSTQDVRFNVGTIDEGRKLANKLWNVSRLILANAGDRSPTCDRRASRSAGSSLGSTRHAATSSARSRPSTSRARVNTLYRAHVR